MHLLIAMTMTNSKATNKYTRRTRIVLGEHKLPKWTYFAILRNDGKILESHLDPDHRLNLITLY